MAFKPSSSRSKLNKKRPRRPREILKCRFCSTVKGGERKDIYIDYKDIDSLDKLLTSRGKIYSRKRSGNCAFCQRKAQKAIKQARFMAMLPFTN